MLQILSRRLLPVNHLKVLISISNEDPPYKLHVTFHQFHLVLESPIVRDSNSRSAAVPACDDFHRRIEDILNTARELCATRLSPECNNGHVANNRSRSRVPSAEGCANVSSGSN